MGAFENYVARSLIDIGYDVISVEIGRKNPENVPLIVVTYRKDGGPVIVKRITLPPWMSPTGVAAAECLIEVVAGATEAHA